MKKYIFIFALTILVLTGFIFSTTLAQEDIDLGDGTEDSDAANQEFLQTISRYKSFSFDLGIFDRPDYKALRDFTTIIPAEPTGRPNPFQPLQGVNGNTGSGPSFSSINASTTKK